MYLITRVNVFITCKKQDYFFTINSRESYFTFPFLLIRRSHCIMRYHSTRYVFLQINLHLFAQLLLPDRDVINKHLFFFHPSYNFIHRCIFFPILFLYRFQFCVFFFPLLSKGTPSMKNAWL